MARITEKSGVVVSEVLSPRTEIVWNPEDDSGAIYWHCHEYSYLNGELIAKKPTMILPTPIRDFVDQTFDIPDAEGQTRKVSGLFIFHCVKHIFDALYAKEIAQQMENAPADPGSP